MSTKMKIDPMLVRLLVESIDRIKEISNQPRDTQEKWIKAINNAQAAAIAALDAHDSELQLNPEGVGEEASHQQDSQFI